MTTTLDVLVVGADRAATDEARFELERAGHRVHLCHDPSGPAFPCAGMSDPSACPLDVPVSVALLVRRGIHAFPHPREDGIRCAIRAGVPVVEDGPDVFDPFGPWVSERVALDGDRVRACESVATRRHEHVRAAVQVRVADLTGVAPGSIDCTIQAEGHDLTVDVRLPLAPDRRLEHAVAVRALDAVRDARGVHHDVSIRVHGTPA